MQRLIQKFKSVFGDHPEELKHARAPGRVNLIGEHTDYNGGFVMPMAIDRDMHVVFRPAQKGRVRLWSENYRESDEFSLDNIKPDMAKLWANYFRGVARTMQESGLPTQPLDAVLYGNVPIGAGLSSSAALEVAAAMALCPDSDIEKIDKKELALVCQKAENEFVGVNCGIMDQFISINAVRDTAALIDCRSLKCQLQPLDTSDLTVVVANTMAEHELGSSAYNERRATCERAVAKITGEPGTTKQLRDITPGTLEKCKDILTSIEYRRSRHVVTENERTLHGAAALKKGDYADFGRLMIQSHRSLRDDYEVSCEELDTMFEIAIGCEGVYGARMTGAGFGGCTVNLVQATKSDDFAEMLAREYEQKTGISPDVFKFKASDGAGVAKVL